VNWQLKSIKVIEPFKVEIVEIPKPEIKKDNDVIVKITSGGICGSDMGIWDGTNSLATYPRIIGHEFGGIVEEIGKGVTQVKIGDKVAVDPVVSCGECYACKIGRHNVCSTLEVMGVHRDGGFSEYIVADEKNIHKFNVDFDESLLSLVEPYTIGVEINNRGQISEGDKVLIMGSGPIGVCAMQVAKRNGAKVMMTDLVRERLEKAKSMGADEIVNILEDNLEERIAAFTNGEGIPVIIDTVCIPSSFEQSVRLACPAGRVVVIGLKDKPSNITMAEITKKELTIVGSRLNNNCFDEVIAGFEDGSLNPEKLKTKEFNYKDIRQAIAMIEEHPQQVLKVVLKFED
jgi:L-gulonate 5-dehydrogenase